MKWLILVLIVITIAVALPPIMYHYVYPSWGGDSAEHMMYFKNMDNAQPLYFGQYLVGKLLNAMPFDITVSFLWFNYILYIVMAWVIGFTVAYSVNWLAGILATILAMFGLSFSVGLFVGGTIFDLIGIGVLLPLAIFFLAKRGWWLVGAFVFLLAFAFFHANGEYLYALAPVVIIYELLRDKVAKQVSGIVKDIWLNRYLSYLGGLVLALLVAYAFQLAGNNSIRFVTDASILAMIVLGGIAGMVLIAKKRAWQYVAYAVIFILSIQNLHIWFENNNVVKQADKEAFQYLNNLSTTNVYAMVSQDIYKLYVKQDFSGYDWAEYIVVRSIPMAYRQGYGEKESRLLNMMDGKFRLVRSFDCGEREYATGEQVVVNVYKRG